MKRLLLVLSVILVPGLAAANPADHVRTQWFRNTASTNSYNLLEGVALNATASARTITLETRRDWSKLRVLVFYTYSAATTATALLTCSGDGVNYAQLTARAISGGTATLSKLTDSLTTGGASHSDPGFMLEYDIRGCQKVQVLFGGASADGGDLVNIQAYTMTGI